MSNSLEKEQSRPDLYDGEPTFTWLRWRDILCRNKNEFEEFCEEDTCSEYEKIEQQKYEGDGEKFKIINDYVMTHFGLIPVQPFNDPTKAFKWYVLHTNFKITKGMVAQIDNLLGVEIQDPFSNYRVRIAIGECFKDKLVMDRVEKCLLRILKETA